MTPYDRVTYSHRLTDAVESPAAVLDCVRHSIINLSAYDSALLCGKTDEARKLCGQALYMLLSAAVQLGYEPDEFSADWNGTVLYFNAMQYLSCLGAESADIGESPYAITNTTSATDAPYSYLCGLARVNGWPPDALIDDTCARFEAKHAPQEAR